MAEPKKSRTEKLLESLGLGEEFHDTGLPNGVFSHSQYNAFKLCGKAYYHKYVEKTPTPQYASTTRGSSVHKGIERALLAKMKKAALPQLEEQRAFVSDTFDNIAKDIQEWGDADSGKVKDETLRLYEAFHYKALPKLNPVAVEKGFATNFGGIPIIGWIDLIDEQPAIKTEGMPPEVAALAPMERITVDFKTSGSKWSDKDLRLDTQLTLYSAVENTPKVRVDQLIPYKSQAAGYVRGESERTPQDIAILQDDMGQVTEFIKNGIFPMAPIDSWACSAKSCAFWSECRGKKR